MRETEEKLVASWRAEERPQPEGWDFSDLAERMTESPVPWNLTAIYRAALADATSVLDMGTGGGEFLRSFEDALPPDTTATEGWPPNLVAAREALGPLAIEVFDYTAPDEDVDSVDMPFSSNRFDLVLNRHESFSPGELARVLAENGQFITQQVGGDEAHGLEAWLGHHDELPHVNLATMRRELETAGFQVVEGAEHEGAYEFRDVAALVAYLQLVPWETRMTSPWTATQTNFWRFTERPLADRCSSRAKGFGCERSVNNLLPVPVYPTSPGLHLQR